MSVLKNIILGFIAGVIATVTVHALISWIFVHYWTGWVDYPWSLRPTRTVLVPDVYIPWVASDALTGGLWGALFGLILGSHPEGMLTIRGAILGLIGPALVGAFLALPYLTGSDSPLFTGNVSTIVPTIAIYVGFGAVATWLYGLFQYKRLPL